MRPSFSPMTCSLSPSPAIAFAGGGSGGHILPGLAVIEALRVRRPGLRFIWVGPGREADRRIVERWGVAYRAVAAAPWPRSVAQSVHAAAALVHGLVQARRLLQSEPIRLVVGMGGYGSAPLVRAAQAGCRPVVLIEPNVVSGRANRWLACRADAVCLGLTPRDRWRPAGWEGETGPGWPAFRRAGHRRATRYIATGVPIRRQVQAIAAQRGRGPTPGGPSLPPPLVPGRQVLLILGGSQGARRLNHAVLGLVDALHDHRHHWQVIHQTGPDDVQPVRSAYGRAGVACRVSAYFDELPWLYAITDLVVSRAGAATLAELMAVGLPAVLVPYAHAASDHQAHNARALSDAGAARMVVDSGGPAAISSDLGAVLIPLLDDLRARQAMAAAAATTARPEAADRVADLVQMLLDTESGQAE